MAKHKGKAKGAELSKKERKALKAREAELLAKLERKAKGKKAGKTVKATIDGVTAEATVKTSSAKSKTLNAAEQVLGTPGSDDAHAAAKTAKAAATEAGDDESTDDIKARVKAKRARRDLLATADYQASVDRADRAAVTAYNDEAKELGLTHYLTSDDERDRALEAKVEAPAMVKAAAKKTAKGKTKAAPLDGPVGQFAAEGTAVIVGDAPLAAGKVHAVQAAVEVETDHGREFAVGESVSTEEFAKPSEAPKGDYSLNGNGQYIVKRLSDGKLVGYTRATTFIKGLEYDGALERWKMRILLEGVAVNDTPEADGADLPEPIVAKMRDLLHVRDTAIAKARKADRKGKLEVGELATYVEGAWRDYKRAVDELAEATLELGGVHEKANHGTDLHALCETHDREGMGAIDRMLDEGTISPADHADVRAYHDACEAAGIKVLLIEQTIVVDDLKVAGRLDRTVLARLPHAQRAIKMVADIKTGRVDYGIGEKAQQFQMYARGQAYDLDTHERTPLGVSQSWALLIHLPAGEARCIITPVDLSIGRKGNALIGQVRVFRNEGKRAYALAPAERKGAQQHAAVNLADPATWPSEGVAS